MCSTSQGKIVYTSPVPTTNVWKQRTFSFIAPDSGKYISFQPLGTGRWTHIDSVTITSGLSDLKNCSKAVNLIAGNITATSVKIKWTEASFGKGYVYEWRKKGADKWLKGATNKVNKTLNGLSPATLYQWRLLKVCKINPDTITSAGFAYGPEFTTPAATTALIDGNAATDTKMAVIGFSAIITPNPANSIATLKVTNAAGAVQVWLRNLQGKTLWQSPKSFQNTFTIDVSRLSHGIYIVLVKDERESKTLKLISK
jgi:hypothetical protein